MIYLVFGADRDVEIESLFDFWETLNIYNANQNVMVSINLENKKASEMIKSFSLSGLKGVSGIDGIGYLNLYKLKLTMCNITDISWISSLTNLKCLDLSNNNITDIGSLGGLKNIGKSSSDFIINSGSCFILKNNNISNLTPLEGTIDNDEKVSYTFLDVSNNALDGYGVYNNVETLLKLQKAGLKKVNISGNSFTDSEIQDLVHGKEINEVTYSGFGEGNVIK